MAAWALRAPAAGKPHQRAPPSTGMERLEALAAALRVRHLAGRRRLLDEDPALARARLPEGPSLLLLAAYQRWGEGVRVLLERGAQPDVFEAAAVGDASRLRALLAAKPSLAQALSPDGFPALHLAAHFGHEEAAAALLVAGARLDARSRSPLGPGNKAQLHPVLAAFPHRG